MRFDSVRKYIDRFSYRKTLPVIAGVFFIVGFLYSRSYTPVWPGDFTAYLGAGYALAEGANPYNYEDVARCLSQNGLSDVEIMPYLYSPVFTLPFTAAEYIGIVWIRRIWFVALHASFWFGFFLLFRNRKPVKKSIAIMFVLGTVLLFVGPYRATARWGQVTAMLFFSVSLAISRQRNSSISGAVLAFIPMIKPALAVPLLYLRGKALVSLIAVTLTLIMLTICVTGFEPWRQYKTALENVSSEWNLGIPGNRSLVGNVGRIVSNSYKEYAEEISENYQQRKMLLAKVKTISSIVSASAILLILGSIVFAIGISRLRSFCRSAHFCPLLCWISLLISPLAYDHYGLFLLPLLVHSIFINKPKLYVPTAVAFTYWSILPSANTFITGTNLFIIIEAVRPVLLALVAVIYARVTSAIPLSENGNADCIN